jgi:WXG100 family type VII secretion target
MATADLSGVPNSQELTALASKFFTADPGAITSIGETWGAAGTNSAGEMNALNGTVDQIKANWTGAGSESFGNWVASFDKSSQNISQALSIASNALKNAAAQLQKAQGNVNKIISQVASDAVALKGEIAQLQAAKKDVTNLEAQLESLAKNASPKVQAEIQQAEAELGDVVTDLNDAINLAEGNFSAIKVPSGVPVNPNIPSNPPTTLTTATTPATGGTPAGGSGGSSGSSGSSSGGGPIPMDTGAATASAAANQNLAKQMIGQSSSYAGWDTGTQWNDLVALWNRESGWSNTAMNPSSGAFGIAQSLPASKYPLAGQPTGMGGSASASAQIQWGLNYILQRYGSPAAAWAHEVADGWY